jgi:hypothetical protein
MKTEPTLLASYSEYDTTEMFPVETYYEYLIEEKDCELDLETFLLDYDTTAYHDWVEGQFESAQEWIYDDMAYEADRVLGTGDYVKVEGQGQRWNGTTEVDTLVRETTLKEILQEYMNIDYLEVEVYEDRVEVRNIHHDGTNSYTLTPFSFSSLTKKQMIGEWVNKDAYEWYGDKVYKATKDDLINFLEDEMYALQERH